MINPDKKKAKLKCVKCGHVFRVLQDTVFAIIAKELPNNLAVCPECGHDNWTIVTLHSALTENFLRQWENVPSVFDLIKKAMEAIKKVDPAAKFTMVHDELLIESRLYETQIKEVVSNMNK